ncbi:MAG: ferritin-like domain-containing protein [Nitrososphaerota archaeon]
MPSLEKLLEFIRKQTKVEKEIVRSLEESLPRVESPAVATVLKGIGHDSMKHADMYEAVEMMLTRSHPPLSHESLHAQRELIERHIEYEARLIRRIEEILPKVEDEKIKLVLNAILADERRHHDLLKKILEVIIRAEAITYEDEWDMIWRDVPFHGSPGG